MNKFHQLELLYVLVIGCGIVLWKVFNMMFLGWVVMIIGFYMEHKTLQKYPQSQNTEHPA